MYELKDFKMIYFARIASLTMNEENISGYSKSQKDVGNEFQSEKKETVCPSNIFDHSCAIRIDSAWTGINFQLKFNLHMHQAEADGFQPLSVRQPNLFDNSPFRRMVAPVRVHSFDSALRAREKGLTSSIAFFNYQIIPRIWRL
uniref:Uncharacterized protein n=1 Tax=Salix viminalis TaxID=40686 RepID=A0A6N2KWC4_SALVM